MEIKVMQDIADDAKANRCVFIRGSKRYDELYSMCSHPLCLSAQLIMTSLPNHHELLPIRVYAQRKPCNTRASGA